MTFVLGCLVLLGVGAWMNSSESGDGEEALAFATATFERHEERFREMSDFMDAHPQVGMVARNPLTPSPALCRQSEMFRRDGSPGQPGYEDDALYMGLEIAEVRHMLDIMKRSCVRRVIHRADATVCMLDLPASFPAAGCVCIVLFGVEGQMPAVQEGMTRVKLRDDGWHVVHNLGTKGQMPVETSCGDAGW